MFLCALRRKKLNMSSIRSTLTIFGLIALAVCVLASPNFLQRSPDVNQANEINLKQSSWIAGINNRWDGMTHQDISLQMGTKLGSAKLLPRKQFSKAELAAVPVSFDARAMWGQKCSSVLEVRDQGACGSCWALSGSSAISDRICIASNGVQQVHVSAQDVAFCGSANGCGGGQTIDPWNYWSSSGVVDGGNFGTNIGCYPYTIAMCDHHVNGTHGPCVAPGGGEGTSPTCTSTCVNSETWSAAKHFGQSAYQVGSDQASIMAEIFTNGPVEVGFNVYDDFPLYKSGVYVQTSQNSLGGHAVKMIGWGHDQASNLDYWLIANSWNSEWGLGGFFKIQRGVDMCGIEVYFCDEFSNNLDEVVAGMAKL